MSLTFLQLISYVVLILAGVNIILVFVSLVLSLLVPRKMRDYCFREPHFSSGEIATYSVFPFNLFRVAFFMRLAAFPESGKKRSLTKAYELAPRWFRVVSKYYIIILLSNFIAFFVFGILMKLIA